MSHEHKVAVERRRTTTLGGVRFVVLRQSCHCGARRHLVSATPSGGETVWRTHAWREGRSHA